MSAQAQHEYLKTAFERAKALGAELIVFDAAAARNVPSGYDFSLARRQLGNFMRILQGHAADAKLRVAVRNYRRAECNLINTVSEAALLPALLMLDRIGIAADTVQMALSSEPLDSIERAGMLMHVYVGNALTRRLPSAGDGEDYRASFRYFGSSPIRGASAASAGTIFHFRKRRRRWIACAR